MIELYYSASEKQRKKKMQEVFENTTTSLLSLMPKLPVYLFDNMEPSPYFDKIEPAFIERRHTAITRVPFPEYTEEMVSVLTRIRHSKDLLLMIDLLDEVAYDDEICDLLYEICEAAAKNNNRIVLMMRQALSEDTIRLSNIVKLANYTYMGEMYAEELKKAVNGAYTDNKERILDSYCYKIKTLSADRVLLSNKEHGFMLINIKE